MEVRLNKVIIPSSTAEITMATKDDDHHHPPKELEASRHTLQLPSENIVRIDCW